MLTLTGKPVAATHWSCLTLAKQAGVSRMSVNRIWQEHKLKPHRVKGFKVSTDPLFAEKLRDVIGLYLAPPEKAIVFSVDEKSQIQALDRTQPGLPMKPGKAGTTSKTDWLSIRVSSCTLRRPRHPGSIWLSVSSGTLLKNKFVAAYFIASMNSKRRLCTISNTVMLIPKLTDEQPAQKRF